MLEILRGGWLLRSVEVFRNARRTVYGLGWGWKNERYRRSSSMASEDSLRIRHSDTIRCKKTLRKKKPLRRFVENLRGVLKYNGIPYHRIFKVCTEYRRNVFLSTTCCSSYRLCMNRASSPA